MYDVGSFCREKPQN